MLVQPSLMDSQYQWICANLRHFNLPLLFGKPMVGKALIAMCGVWLTDCKNSHIASRCTLAFVNSWLTKSTLPFVWDDPSSPEDVSQLGIDLANGAVRGKATEEARTPLTACLDTANFDMQNLMKYFSRLFVIKVVAAKKEKMPGDANVLEDDAKSASSALPALLQTIGNISSDFINQHTSQLKLQLPGADLRILEGISYPLAVAKMVVTATTATIVKGAELAMKKNTLTKFLQCHDVVGRVKDLGGRINKTVWLDGRPTKCMLLPKSLFSDDNWQSFMRRIFDFDEEEVTERSEEEDQLPQLMLPATDDSFGELPPSPPPAVDNWLDTSLPSPPHEAKEDDADFLDLFLPPPPEELLPEIQPALEICRMANLMSAIPASPGNKCAKCRKVGRPGVDHV